MFLSYSYVQLTIFYFTALFGISLTAKQKIYYGEAELVQQLLTNNSQWTYVQQNADGFY
ncbi:unnamed protein product, partial [Adineta steineri]